MSRHEARGGRTAPPRGAAEDRDLGPAWEAVRAAHQRLAHTPLSTMFAADPARVARCTVQACGLYVDWSKNRIDEPAMAALQGLARAADLSGWTARMLAGEAVNVTEGRAALHVALRAQGPGPFPSASTDVMPGVRAVLARIEAFCRRVRDGTWTGYRGDPIEAVVNIGIGGSDLGPKMVCEALYDQSPRPLPAHFVSNLDRTDLARTLANLDPRRTLFVIASKTFGTQETLTNARSARRWLVEAAGDEAAVARHFVAVSTNEAKVREFGIDAENMFEFWDWVGGRYSLWSAIGLSIALSLGYAPFQRLLAGAAEMDRHFREAPWERNLPILLGLLQIWYRDLFAAQTRAVLPYDYALRLFPDYLQQLEMESLGKRATRDGAPVGVDTCPVVWGGPGNNGQHAFYQLLHQGTTLIPSEFIVPAFSQHPDPEHDQGVIANALAQMEALMRGRTEREARAGLAARHDAATIDRLAPHLVMAGNQPSTAIVYERLSPEVLGALIALYEHKVFVQSVCWQVNPFDQFGVELGKQLAGVIGADLDAGETSVHDPSTSALIDRLRGLRAGGGRNGGE